MGPALALAFNLPGDALERLRGLAAGLSVRVKAVPPESFTTPIGAMVGIPVRSTEATVAQDRFDDPMLVMCGLNEEQFDQFLKLLRQPGLPRIPLKAVLTPHNVGWNAIQLHDELAREREAMTRKKP